MDLSAVVINLRRRPERLRAFLRRWDAVGAPAPLRVHEAVDTGSDAGCTASHVAALDAGDGPLLVLEDDAVFAPGFTLALDPPAGWDLLWLGGEHRIPPSPVTPGWARPRYLLRTHAYIARQPRRLAQAIRDARVPRLDPYMSFLELQQYVLTTHTVGQCSGVSDIDKRVRQTDQYWNFPRRSAFWDVVGRKSAR